MSKICYFIPGAVSSGPLGPAEIERRQAYLADRASPGIEVSVRDVAEGPASIESSAEELAAADALITALPELEVQGFKAVIVGCFSDPGLAPGREVADIPLVGPAQASIHLAAQLGDRFGILTVLDSVVPGLRRLVRAYGMEPLLASLRAVEVQVLDLGARRDEVLDRLVSEGQASLDEGADALVLGCMTMGFLGLSADLQERLGAPIVNPVLAGLRAAETMLACDLAPARSAYPGSPKVNVAAEGRDRFR